MARLATVEELSILSPKLVSPKLGCDAIVVGEGPLRSGDPAARLAEFRAAR